MKILEKIFDVVVLILASLIGIVMCIVILRPEEININRKSYSTEDVDNYNIENNRTENNRIENIVLVNKENKLSEKYIPDELVEPNILTEGPNNLVSSKIVSNLESMFNDAKLEGINLKMVSGYRSYAYQYELFSRSGGNNRYVAAAGFSEHQTGLAVDVLSSALTELNESFAYTLEYQWLKENCYKYGFIIRYPKGKEDITGYPFEPWHLRYVGLNAAKEISQKNITLEEYLKN